LKETEDLKRWILWGTIPFILLFGYILVFHIILVLPTGPGLPQHMDFSGAVIGNAGSLCASTDNANRPESEFCVSQKNSGNYPEFPSLSPMAGYAVFRKTGTDFSYVAAIWYFENPDECATSEKELSQYLNDHGQVLPVTLDLTQEIQSWKYTGKQVPSPVLKGTAFENNDTTGYFFAVKNAIVPSRNDCFIEYFGRIDESDLSAGSTDLRQLIALEGNPWYLFTGQTGPLSEQGSTKQNGIRK
jgi:hypothetical protein